MFRNPFKGAILPIGEGAVNGMVRLDTGGNVASAAVWMSFIRALSLKAGSRHTPPASRFA